MSDAIQFLLNGHVETVRDLSPTTTLLQYLRRHKRLTGTKEGCAEGDCGACTVVVGDLEKAPPFDMRLNYRNRYRAVNACILFLPMVHGRSVYTAEWLRDSYGDHEPGDEDAIVVDHPVVRRFVDSEASQCGFCSPGFVMSVWAAHLENESLTENKVNDLLAGNLCRCTGYGPIIKAATALDGELRTSDDEYDLDRHAKRTKLTWAFDPLNYRTEDQVWLSPTTIEGLAKCYEEHPDATLMAGATDVGLWVTKQHRRLETVIDVGRIPALQKIEKTDRTLQIGAGVTYTQAFEVLASRWPDFGELLRRLGGRQVRNSGTIGGNIANGSPIGDTPPVLIALGATVVLRKGNTQRRLPPEDFFLDYGKQDRAAGEFVEAIEIPLDTAEYELRCYKISKRFDQDISAVCGAFNIRIEEGNVSRARIAFGGMAATPKRAAAVEAALLDRPWTAETVEAAAAAFSNDFAPISDMRASAEYRLLVAQNLLRRCFHESGNPLTETRLVGAGAAFE